MKIVNPRLNNRREEIALEENSIAGINPYDSAGKLQPGECLEIVNLDLYGPGYAKTRKGFEPATPYALFPANGTAVRNHVFFDAGDYQFLIVQTNASSGGNVVYCNITTGGNWASVQNTTTALAWAETGDIQFVTARDRILVFGEAGNSVVEFGSGVPVRRDMGLVKPLMNYRGATTTITDPTYPGIVGAYVWGVELVRKQGTPAVAILGSGVSRTINFGLPTSVDKVCRRVLGPSPHEVTIGINSTVAASDNLWTHARLYRSKRLDAASTTDIPTGSEFELYLIQEVDKATFVSNSYRFAPDAMPDYSTNGEENLPVISLGAVLALEPAIDLSPLPPAGVGAFINASTWFTRVPSMEYGYSSVWFTPNDYSIYAEAYKFTNQVPCLPGDGQRITNLSTLDRDLVVFKEASTGRIPSAQISSNYETLDPGVGVPDVDGARVVGKMGVLAEVSGNRDIMYFGRDLVWRNSYKGIEISRPLRERRDVSAIRAAQFCDHDGKLYYTKGENCYVLHYREGRGWTTLKFSEDSAFYIMDVDMNGTYLYMLKATTDGFLYTQKEEDSERGIDVIDSAEVYAEWTLKTGPYQHDNGRSVIEQTYISVEAAVSNPMAMDVFMVNRTQQVKDDEYFELTPDPHTIGTTPPVDEINEATVVEYQYYANPQRGSRTRIYAERLFYRIASEGPAFIYAPRFYGFKQIGTRPPRYSFQSTLNDLKEIQYLSSPEHWLTRYNMEVDRPKLPDLDTVAYIPFLIVESEDSGYVTFTAAETDYLVLEENNPSAPSAGNPDTNALRLIIFNAGTGTDFSADDYTLREGTFPNPWN